MNRNSKYITAFANILLLLGLVLLFIDWRISILCFALTITLWSWSKALFKKNLQDALKNSAAVVAAKYASPEGIAEMKAKGFTDEMIKALQDAAAEDAKKGIFRKE